MNLSSNFHFYCLSKIFNAGGEKNTTGVENLTRLLELGATTSGNGVKMWSYKILYYQCLLAVLLINLVTVFGLIVTRCNEGGESSIIPAVWPVFSRKERLLEIIIY